jgi:hypothetical protein
MDGRKRAWHGGVFCNNFKVVSKPVPRPPLIAKHEFVQLFQY